MAACHEQISYGLAALYIYHSQRNAYRATGKWILKISIAYFMVLKLTSSK